MTRLDRKISEKLLKLLNKNQHSNFSCSVVVGFKGKKSYIYNFGKAYKFYDLASMTKSIFTGLYFLDKSKSDKNFLKTRVCDVLPWLHETKITLESFLTHTSGLESHKEHYKELNKTSNKNLCLKNLLRKDLNKLQNTKPLYSDLGYLILYQVVRELEGFKSMDLILEDLKKKFKLSKGFHFNTDNISMFKKSLYAPTEKCKWRKRKLQAEVFDDNTWAMGGASTHAGLFGSIEDMFQFYFVLRDVYNPDYFKKKTKGWTMGFMMPSGSASTAGSFFSKDSIGHLGFTGTSFWFDPKVDFYVSVLSNRTYPERTNNNFKDFRPWVHDLLYKEFLNEQS